MPYYPIDNSDSGVKHGYEIEASWEHLVKEYAGISIFDVQELDLIDYLMFRRDAFIERLSQSEKGIEYLNNAWRLEQVNPDRESLREKFGKEGK